MVSDIHAISEELKTLPDGRGYFGEAGSAFEIEGRTRGKNRILAIADCLKTEEREIDALICLGDLAHQAKKLVFLQVWRDLHEVAETLAIPLVVGVTGNHDIASRVEDFRAAADRIEFLKQVNPQFPSSDESFNSAYREHGVASMELDGCILVAIDTCRLHGLGKDDNTSAQIWSVGFLTDDMIDRVITAIEDSTSTHAVVLMHHHPRKVDEIEDTDYDEIPSGCELLRRLSASSKNCVVLHGHKHMVNLRRRDTDANHPPLLSAASLAAYACRERSRNYSNQFHVLEIDTSVQDKAQGTVLSWEWGSFRWEKSKKHAMPHKVRFGPIPSLDQIEKAVAKLGILTSMNQAELFKAVPDIKFLDLKEIEELNERLKQTGIEILLRQSEIGGAIKQEEEQ